MAGLAAACCMVIEMAILICKALNELSVKELRKGI